MLTDSTTRYVRPAYSGPARDHPGSVGIRVRRETARGATECRLVGPVAFSGVSASGTLPAAVPGVHADQADTRPFRFVLQERPQLGESPTVQNSPLPPCSPYPVAYPRQFLDGDPAPGAFCGGNDLLRNNMVDVFGKTADIKCPRYCRFCRWDRRWTGGRDTRMRRRGALANVGASGTCAKADSRVG